MEQDLTVHSIGDLILDAPHIDSYFEPSRESLVSGDMLVAQIEVPHTLRGQWSNPEPNSAPAADPENLTVLGKLGLDVATLGGNHIFDQGVFGVIDTIDKLRALGIATAGAGADIDEARRPAIVEKKGLKAAVLEYNTVGPSLSWATPLKAGCAFLKVVTHYDMDRCGPGTAPTYVYTITDPASLRAMEADIASARASADIVLCYFHMGRMCASEILTYQREITHAAIDSGADFVACHHAHALLGVELYRGKPIFYGLGHFVAVSGAFEKGSPIEAQHRFAPFESPETRPYWHVRYDMPKPPIPYYVFDESSRHTMIARARFTKDGVAGASILPFWIDGRGYPAPVSREGGDEFMRFMRKLCEIGELNTHLNWSADGREITVI